MGVVEANVQYNVFEHNLMKQVINELLVEGVKLPMPAKKVLVEKLANRRMVASTVDSLGKQFQEVNSWFINMLLKINFS